LSRNTPRTITATVGSKTFLDPGDAFGFLGAVPESFAAPIFIACVDGLKGFPEAIEAIYPQTQIQLCIVHLVRHSLFYISHKDRKEIAQDLKLIYQAPTLDEADYQLGKFADKWNAVYPVVVKSWRSNWTRVIPMFETVKFFRTQNSRYSLYF
jgi:transposase-like protein